MQGLRIVHIKYEKPRIFTWNFYSLEKLIENAKNDEFITLETF